MQRVVPGDRRSRRRLTFALFLWMLAPSAFAAAFTSVQSGDWQSPATWGAATAPGAGDTVTILASHTIAGSVAMNADAVTIQSGGVLQATNGSSLGALSLSGLFAPVPGATVTLRAFSFGGTFTPGGGTIVFAAPTAITLPSTTFANLRIAAGSSASKIGGTLAVTSTLSLDGTLSLASGGIIQTLDFVAGAASSLVNNPGSELRITGNLSAATATVPFGLPVSSGSFGAVVFNGTTPQTITSDLFIPSVRIGDGSVATSVAARIRTNTLLVRTLATFEPADGSQFGSVQSDSGSSIAPEFGAALRAGGWSVGGTFAANSGTVRLGPTSWGAGPASFTVAGTLTFANLTIASGATVQVNSSLTSTGTLQVDGTLQMNQTAQIGDLVASGGSSIAFLGFPAFRISRNFTTASPNAPFGVPATGTTPVQFNGTTPQTITGDPFIPSFSVGDGFTATNVSGAVHSNSVTVNNGAVFQPGEGSEFGTLTGVSVTPVSGAAIRVGGWNVSTFTPNGSTVTFGPTSWGAGSSTISIGSGLTFANLTVPSGTSLTFFSPATISGTLELNGSLRFNNGGQLGEVLAGASSSMTFGSLSPVRIRGDFASASTAAPFGAPASGTSPIQFNGTTPQTVSSGLFIPSFTIGDGAATTTVAGEVRANAVTVNFGASFRPGDASQFGSLQAFSGSVVSPASGASITAGSWNVASFTANGSTVTLGPTSWGAGSSMQVPNGTLDFASLRIPATTTVRFNVPLNVSATFTLDGTASLNNINIQVKDFVAGSASAFPLAAGNQLRVTGNFTVASTTAPFGAAAGGTSQQVQFIGTATQTISGNPFIPAVFIGTGSTASVVTGRLRANNVTVQLNALFQPADGSQFGNLQGSGSVTPVPNATITAGGWNPTTFTANGGTVILGQTSWGTGSSFFFVNSGASFANLTIAAGVTVTITPALTVTATLQIDGNLTLQNTAQVRDVVANGDLTLNPSQLFRISGDFTSTSANAPFGSPPGASMQVRFNGSGTQTISGGPYIPSFTIGEGASTTTVTGNVRSNSVTLSSNATFAPGSGTEVESLFASSGTVIPVAGASFSLGNWNVASFTANGSTVSLRRASWNAGPASINMIVPFGVGVTFANLTIPVSSTVNFANPFNSNALTVTGTLLLDGALSPSQSGSLIHRYKDIVAGAGSFLLVPTTNTTQISGNLTSSSSDAPFGAPSGAASTPLVFVSNTPQAVTDGVFIPSFTVGTGSTTTTLSGRIRSNSVTVAANAVFRPGDQSELGALSGGNVIPAAGATLFVSTSWNVSGFQPNGGTIAFGPTSWLTPASLTASGSSTFDNVTFRANCNAQLSGATMTVRRNLLVDGVVQDGTFVFSSATAQSISGSGTFSPGGVTVNNIQSVNAQIDILAGSLQLLAGKLKTSEKVIVAPGGTVTRVAGWIDGTLRRTLDLNVASTFDVGGLTGYSPVVFRPTTGAAAGNVEIRATEDPHPVPLGGNALRRYWNILAPGFTNADLTLQYNSADVVGTESNLRLVRFSAGSWTSLGTITNAIAHEVQHIGATTFGDFGLVSPATALAFGPINGGVSPRATVPFPVVVKAVDADGGSVIVLTSTDVVVSLDPLNAGSGALGGNLTATIPANHSTVTLSNLTYSQTSSGVRLRAERGASGESLATGFSAPLTFLSLAANHLGVDAPPAATAGTPFSVTVSALDANGIVDSGYRGRVHFTTSDALAIGPADYTFTATDLGSHTFSVTLLSSGAQSLAFTDTATSSIQGSDSVTVTKGSTTATLTAAPNPSTYGQSVTLTATVDPVAPAIATPTGTVTFFDGATSLGTVALSSGTALLTDSSLAAGVRSLSATYNGSNSYNSSTSGPFLHTIDPSPTSTTLTATPNPSVFGQSVVFTVTVAASGAGGGVPSGTVSLLEGATTLGSGSLDASGQVQIPLANLPVGAHSLTAAYTASVNHAASTSSAYVQNVGESATAIALVTSNASTIFGDAVTFTATLSAVSPGAGLPTGTVEFFDGATSLGTGAVDGIGEASLTTSSLSVATHPITAIYGGDASFDSGTSSAVSQAVAKATPMASLVSSAMPSSFGQSVTFTATLSSPAATPTGTVTFTDGATTLGAVPLSDGIATYTSSSLALGAHSITATYGGDGSFLGASDSLTQTVEPTATSVVVTATPAPSTFGEEIAITATVTPATAITPTGNVVFKEGTTTLDTVALVNGVATFETSDLTAGSHSIVAEYVGDTNSSAGSGSLVVTVNPAPTATVIATSGTPSLFGQSVTFTIHVTPALSGLPTGTVTLSEGASTIATVPLTGGVATHSTAALSVGTHTITATYNGDANFNGSADDVEQVVQKSTATVAVVSGSASTTYGQSVTFTATLTASSGNPTGTIRFVDGATDLGTVGVTAGSAAFTTSALTPGSHSITAVYSGDASFETATSPAIAQTVSAAPSTTTLGSSAAPSTFGQSVTFTATVASAAGIPTGSIVFAEGATELASVPLTNGIAQFVTNALTVGSHLLSATYSGNANVQASSTTLTQVVDVAATTTSLASSLNPAPFGTSLDLTASVASNVTIAGGTVTFYEGANLLGTVPLSGVAASLSIGSARNAGAYSFTATYSGTATHGSSTAQTLAQTIDPVATSVVVASSVNPAAVGAPIQFTATVSSATGVVPVGSVTFFDGATSLGNAPLSGGVATLLTTLAAGDHPITASYSGAANLLASSSAVLTQSVGVVVIVTGITPQSICQSAAPFTLTVHGDGFDATTRVQWNGVTRTTTLVDANTVTISVATADIAAAGTVSIGVLDAGSNPVANPQTFTIHADVTPPLVVAPPPITVAQSVCSPDGPGARASDVPALLAFLQSATATDECSTPIALAPRLDGVEIEEDTVFPGGMSSVTFRFNDHAGNVALSVSQVTVQLFGDLSGDGNADATDRLILENYLVGNLQQGTAPFLAPLSAADLNGDGNVDSTDSLLLANQLVGNIDCLRTNRASADLACASGDAAFDGRRRAVRPPSATEIAFPVRIDLTGVRIDEQPATLGSYVVRVTFDPDRVRMRSVRGGATPQFAASPAATEALLANRSGVLRISGVQLDRYAPIGLIDVARVRFVEIAPGGLSTVRVEIESLAHSFVPGSTEFVLSMPATGGRIR